MRSRLIPLTIYLTAIGLATFMSACSSSEESGCSTSEDCAAGEVCRVGECVVPTPSTCTLSADCPDGPYACVNGLCRVDRSDPDAGQPDTALPPDDIGTTPDSSNPPDTSTEDVDQNPGAPTVVEVQPADGSTDIAPDAQVVVTFSEPMDFTTLTYLFIELETPGNRVIDATLQRNDDNTVATLTPAEPLHPATTYQLEVSSTVRDADGTPLEETFRSRFTTAFDQPANYPDLANRWAPIVYQSMAEPEGRSALTDIPTTLDFDGNTNAADNALNARSANSIPAAHVYYHISETASYYFIHYILYYPARYDLAADNWSEHDFAGAVFVVDKRDDSLLLVEGVRLVADTEIAIGYKPDASPSALLGPSGNDVSLTSFPDSALQTAGRYPMYVPSGVHSTCNWADDGRNGRCVHNPFEFPGGADKGVVLHPSDAAQTWAEATDNADTGFKEMNYKLVPFASTLWTSRADIGEGRLFQIPFVYSPTGDTRPVGINDEGFLLPRRVLANDDDSFGRTPFNWLPSAGANNHGQWLLDPAYILQNRYKLSDSVEVDYCYNLFFNIDQTATTDCAAN